VLGEPIEDAPIAKALPGYSLLSDPRSVLQVQAPASNGITPWTI
jgi:hypothetical protein